MNNHPQIAALYRIYQQENQSFRKAHRMIDLFESIIKSHTVLIIAEYVKHNKLSDAAKGLLAQGLRTPSLGTWQLFSRVLFEELERDNYNWLLSDFAFEFAALDKALNIEKTNVIALRNGYAHGATPTDAQCEADIKKFEPFLTQLLESKWLNASSLKVRDNKVYLVCKAGELTLHPMLLFRNEESDVSFAFFNDLKNDKIGLLNYPLSKHYREKDFYAEFHEHLPLHEWKKTGNNEFYQRIEELTETFKGRTIEREKLLQFVLHNHKGYFSIQGNPGIGKSALIAQFFKDLRSHAEVKKLKVIEYFIRRGTQQAQVEYMFNYLIRRTDEVFSAGKEIRAEGKMVFDLQYQLFAKWRLWSEQANGQQLLFLIDGLDEGVENNVLTYLPRENFEHILIIYGSRPGGHKSIDDLWATLPVVHHQKIELTGLSKEDIRALIYEVANKYLIERDSPWIDAVQKRSQGNPLYLKLLCDALENGSMHINNINALPKAIDEYYKAILLRYANDPDGDALLDGLFTFTAAKDYLTIAHLGYINQLGAATLQRISSTLKEVLYENPLTEEVLDYQLFHESFREYLAVQNSKEIQEATERLIDFCATWNELSCTWEQRYALEHYATHLAESKKANRSAQLVVLAEDTEYTQTQKHVLKHFAATQKLYRLVLEQANTTKDYDTQLEAALYLVDLHYEEQNDAHQVIALVTTGNPEDLALALKRIESFGAADKEGMQRRFMLYMLCLMELTILESKNKPFSKSAIEKLLEHLDEQIPSDTSLINWNDYFPSYLMFLMACEWAALGLDYLLVYKRTIDRASEWISEKGPYSNLQIEVLLECARDINEVYNKTTKLASISTELAKQSKLEESASTMQEALVCVECNTGKLNKISALVTITKELSKQGKNEEALSFAKDINDDNEKSSALANLSTELAKQGKVEESFTHVQLISSDWHMNSALAAISNELAKQGKVEESLAIARNIIFDGEKSSALAANSTEMAKHGKHDEAASAMQEALVCARSISSDRDKKKALKNISTELANQGKIEEALTTVDEIIDYSIKSVAMAEISTALAMQDKIELCANLICKALEYARNIRNDLTMSRALESIIVELCKQGKINQAIKELKLIKVKRINNDASHIIYKELLKNKKYDILFGLLHDTLTLKIDINLNNKKLKIISEISSEFAKKAGFDKGLKYANQIPSNFWKSNALLSISVELHKNGLIEESYKLLKNTLVVNQDINDIYQKDIVLKDICTELFKQGFLIDAINQVSNIKHEEYRSLTLINISSEYIRQGKINDGYLLYEKALECAIGMSKSYRINSTLKKIAYEMVKVGQLQNSIECVKKISDVYENASALISISNELFIQSKLSEADDILQKAIMLLDKITSKTDKIELLSELSTELLFQGKVIESKTMMDEIQFEINELINLNNSRINPDFIINICIHLIKQNNWELAEITGNYIKMTSRRHDCWKWISNKNIKKVGLLKALFDVNLLTSDEARLFYLKGWAENVSINDATIDLVTAALPYFVNDTESIEQILQQHALHEVVFNAAPPEKIKQLNSTLNIQWFLDIHNSLPQSPTATRLSTNLETWLHEIEDEDDQDQITLWAKQVAKGKITEEEFQAKIKDI